MSSQGVLPGNATTGSVLGVLAILKRARDLDFAVDCTDVPLNVFLLVTTEQASLVPAGIFSRMTSHVLARRASGTIRKTNCSGIGTMGHILVFVLFVEVLRATIDIACPDFCE